jgi:hypothetical protein
MAATVLKEHAGAPSALPLDSFRVSGFRGLRDLRIPELGRVNLFVGMNNAGKSSLLEAIHLYAGGATPTPLQQLLTGREEIPPGNRSHVDPEVLDAALSRLFHADGPARGTHLTLGPIDVDARELSIRRGWATRLTAGESLSMRFSTAEPDDFLGETERALEVRVGGSPARVIPNHRVVKGFSLAAALQFLYPAMFVSPSGLSTEVVAFAWDRVSLTDEEDLVTAALRIIAPEVERLSVIGDVDGPYERRVMVRLQGQSTPVPLRTMGDGMNRLLGIALALAISRDGILLIDEVENGIHYSVQADVWRMILNTAALLNVQVFATTHSWDCIRAFAAATSSAENGGSMLYRLDTRIKGEVRAVRYTASDVAIAAEQQIEVR